ncbi:type IV conjugative transfer system protein TraL [Pseudomonadota bacterium]
MSDEIEAFYIPKHLDDPDKLLFLTYSEFAIILAPTIVGFFVNHMFMGFILGSLGCYLYRKLKKSGNDFFMKQLMYWYMPKWFSGYNYSPESYKRFYIG